MEREISKPFDEQHTSELEYIHKFFDMVATIALSETVRNKAQFKLANIERELMQRYMMEEI